MDSDRFFLIVRAPNGDVRELSLESGALVLGRDESSDIRVDDKKVSRRHAAFKLIDGVPFVEDLGSSNGVRLNGERIDKRSKLTEADKVRVGGFYISLKVVPDGAGASVQAPSVVEAAPKSPPKVIERAPAAPQEDLPSLRGLDPPVRGKTFRLQRGENIVGRLEECDVPILDGSVSRQHARLVFARERVTASDLGSSNGIFVNDVRVDMVELAQGDELKVGSVRFEVYLPAKLAGRMSGPVRTRARANTSDSARRRWFMLGLSGIVLAGIVVSATVYWKTKVSVDAAKGQLLSEAALPAASKGTSDAPSKAPEPASTVDAAVPEPGPEAAAVPAPGPASDAQTSARRAPERPAPTPTEDPTSAVRERRTPAPAGARLARTVTATSPYARRDEAGLPLGLPVVDPDFDFDAFVADKLEAARVCEEGKDFECLRGAVQALLDADPINPEAKALSERAARFEEARVVLARADRLVAKGRFADAHQLLATIDTAAPQASEAKERADKIQALAIEDALGRAKSESKRSRTWARAHRRYVEVLALDESNEPALRGIRSLERKMRKKNLDFTQYEPSAGAGAPSSKRDLEAAARAIERFYGGDDALAAAARAYARGAVKKAKRKAAKAAKSSRRATRQRAQRVSRLLKELKKRYARTRTEISNDPDRAWSMLLQFEKMERELLPEGTRSFLAKELRVNLSEAFSERGSSMYDRGRYEEAFQRWLSGFKLDPTNPSVRAGLERLEREAETIAKEAELAGQRGDPSACDKWREVTRITRAPTDTHKKARDRALALCR